MLEIYQYFAPCFLLTHLPAHLPSLVPGILPQIFTQEIVHFYKTVVLIKAHPLCLSLPRCLLFAYILNKVRTHESINLNQKHPGCKKRSGQELKKM